MEEAKKVLMTERLFIVMEEGTRDNLSALAAANTGENKSYLIRMLIDAAHNSPEKFGLRPPIKMQRIVPV